MCGPLSPLGPNSSAWKVWAEIWASRSVDYDMTVYTSGNDALNSLGTSKGFPVTSNDPLSPVGLYSYA